MSTVVLDTNIVSLMKGTVVQADEFAIALERVVAGTAPQAHTLVTARGDARTPDSDWATRELVKVTICR